MVADSFRLRNRQLLIAAKRYRKFKNEKRKIMKKLLLTLTFALIGIIANSQELPKSLIDRVNSVNYIFEGQVLESTPYYTNSGQYIRTSNLVQITKILKGELECGTVEIITNGGEIDNKTLEISHGLKLYPNSTGIFLCNLTNRELSSVDFYSETNLEKLEGSYEYQSFIRYWWDGQNINAADLWQNFDSLNLVYNITEQISGLNFQDCGTTLTLLDNYEKRKLKEVINVAPKADSIISFSPQVLAGGIDDTLTISGNSFGSNKGWVLFPNADDGGTSEIIVDENQISIWNDSIIKFVVPSVANHYVTLPTNKHPAGSGVFKVFSEFGSTLLVDTIEVLFSVMNHTTDYRPFVVAPWTAMNQKFTFRCDTAVANYDGGKMKTTINKALNDWKCLTGIDWELGNDINYLDPTALEDTICTITFLDFPDTSNILAWTHTYKGRVNIPDTSYQIYEIDIEINSDHNWFSDTLIANALPAGQQDLYAVILHELGHAHGLNHVINTSAVMNYAVNPITRIIQLSNDISCDQGGNWMADFTNDLSNLHSSFFFDRMTFDTINPCSNILSVIEMITIENISVQLYPNPCNHFIQINSKDLNYETLHYSIFDISGKEITAPIQMFEGKIDVSNISNGYYIIRVHDLNKQLIFASKFLKE